MSDIKPEKTSTPKKKSTSQSSPAPKKTAKSQKTATPKTAPVEKKPAEVKKEEPVEKAKSPSFPAYLLGLFFLILIVLAVLFIPQMFLETTSGAYATITYGDDTYILTNAEVDRYMVIVDAEGVSLTREEMGVQLVNLNILLLEALNQGFELDTEEILAQIAQFDILISEQMSDVELTSALAERGFTKDEFVAELRRSLAKDLVIQQLLAKEVYEKYAPTEADLQVIYAENINAFSAGTSVSARHILICHTGSVRCESTKTKQEALAFANAILADITAGSITFEEAAQIHSDGPSGPRGGDLGAFSSGQMVAAFEQAAFAAEIGAVTQPVETDFGYHLITVYDKADSATATFTEVRPQLEQIYQQDVLRAKEQEYVQGVIDAADVEVAE